MRAVGYIRTSKGKQGSSAEIQEDGIRAWCTRENAEIIGMFYDIGVSGGKSINQRSGLTECFRVMKEKSADLLVVTFRDRLARDVDVARAIDKRVESLNARVVSLSMENGGAEKSMANAVFPIFARWIAIEEAARAAVARFDSNDDRLDELRKALAVLEKA